MSEKLLEIKNLKVRYVVGKEVSEAVNGITLTLNKGETLGLVGETGAGKTTTALSILNMLPQYVSRAEGEILFHGRDVLKMKNRELRKMRGNADALTASAVHLVRIGVCKALARALAMDPKFIVCDEPVSALDVSIQAQILNLMMDLQDQMGLTYLFITHNLAVVKHISDDIAVMYLGQMVEKSETDGLFADPLHPYTQALLKAIPIPEIGHRNSIKNVLKGEITSPIEPKPGCRFAPRCPYATEACRSVEPTLSEVKPGHFVACHLFDTKKQEEKGEQPRA